MGDLHDAAIGFDDPIQPALPVYVAARKAARHVRREVERTRKLHVAPLLDAMQKINEDAAMIKKAVAEIEDVAVKKINAAAEAKASDRAERVKIREDAIKAILENETFTTQEQLDKINVLNLKRV